MMIIDRYFGNITLERQRALEQSVVSPGTARPVTWDKADRQLQTAKVRLGTGGTVFLTVERLGQSGWDWLVWDENSQVIPRYGIADSNAQARQQAELMLAEVNAILLEAIAPGWHGAERTPDLEGTEH